MMYMHIFISDIFIYIVDNGLDSPPPAAAIVSSSALTVCSVALLVQSLPLDVTIDAVTNVS
jgi:hypothetical protein